MLFSILLVTAFVPQVGMTEQILSDAEARQTIEVIERNAKWAEEGLQKLQSDHLDREVLLETLDYDPQAIVAWIAGNTLWVPYAGTLRGVDGVLMDRRGNSLDRSLLLSALLEDTGVETRLVRVELPADTALQLLAEHVGDQAPKVGPRLEASERLRALYAELDAGSRALAALAGLAGGQDSAAIPADFLRDIQDHWWVQARPGTRWVDFDPLIPVGSSHARPAAQQTFVTADKIPAELFHSMRLNVIIERWQDGELFEEVALSHAFTPRDAVRGHVLELDLFPFAEAWQEDDALSGAAVLEVADEAELWLPILRVDHAEVEYGQWISRAGTLEKNPMRWAADRKVQQAANALSALGRAAEGTQPEGHLTAVWLEYQIHRPGGSPRIVRRELIDILGVDRRDPEALAEWAVDDQKRRARGYAMQTNSVALVSIAVPQRPALEHVIYRYYTDNRPFQIAQVYQAAGWEDERIEPSLGTAKPYPVDLLGMMTARGLWSRHRDRMFQDEINIWSNHLLWHDNASSNGGLLVTDIVANHVGALASTASQAKLMRIEEGMLDTFIEQHLSVDATGQNAYGRFVNRDPVGSDWRLLTRPGTGLPGDLPTTESVRLAEAMERGARVVVAEEISQFGGLRFPHWWQVDPADGTTVGMGYRGWGTQYVERGSIQVPAKVFDAAQKRGIATRACKVGTAIVKVSTGVVLVQNPVLIDIAYVIELEAASLHVTQTSSGISKICG